MQHNSEKLIRYFFLSPENVDIFSWSFFSTCLDLCLSVSQMKRNWLRLLSSHRWCLGFSIDMQHPHPGTSVTSVLSFVCYFTDSIVFGYCLMLLFCESNDGDVYVIAKTKLCITVYTSLPLMWNNPVKILCECYVKSLVVDLGHFSGVEGCVLHITSPGPLPECYSPNELYIFTVLDFHFH